MIASSLPSRKGDILIAFPPPHYRKKKTVLRDKGTFQFLQKLQVQYNPSSRQAHLSSSAETQGEVLFRFQKIPRVQTGEEKRWNNSQAKG